MPSLVRRGCALAWLLLACESQSGSLERDAASDASASDARVERDAAIQAPACELPTWGALTEPPPCSEGRVCHLDGTCVAPGTPDSEGVEPLFKDAVAPYGTSQSLGIAGYAVHDDAIYWSDWGSVTPNNDPNGDGSFRRFDLATFEDAVIDPGRTSVPHVDSEWLYLGENAGIRVRALESPQIDVHVIGNPTRAGTLSWIASAGTVFYVDFDRDPLAIHRWRQAEGDVAFVEIEGGESVLNMASDGDRLLVELYMPNGMTQLLAVNEAGTSSVLIEEFRSVSGPGEPFILAGDRVISQSHGDTQLQQHDLDSGAQRFIDGTDAAVVTSMTAHEGQLYFVVSEGTTSENRKSTLKRVSLDGGDAETLTSTTQAISALSVHDGYLYWVANDRRLLVRRAL